MLFMDDDYMNLIDVSVNHPEIDIIHASKYQRFLLIGSQGQNILTFSI